MTFSLKLADLWVVKIYSNEAAEEPHFHLYRGPLGWRFSLRTLRPLTGNPKRPKVPKRVFAEVRTHLPTMQATWNERYPHNPV